MLNSILLFLGLGVTEAVLIVVVVLLMFGGKKIPELMRGLGKGIKEFKTASNGEGETPTAPNKDQDAK
jgi:sec-independent protein translocase protein TatA